MTTVLILLVEASVIPKSNSMDRDIHSTRVIKEIMKP